MLTLILGPSGSGKSVRLREELRSSQDLCWETKPIYDRAFRAPQSETTR